MRDPARHTAALLLAGGRAERMDGADKGLQLLHGEALALHVLRRLAPHVSQTIISANRNLDVYRALGAPFGARIVSDDDPPGTFAGPLAGILAGLRAADTPLVLCAPCDVPFVPLDLAQRLHAARRETGADVAYAVTLERHGARREHPLCALLERSLADDLARSLAAGERKVRTWYTRHKAVEVIFDDERAFYNVNALQDLAELARR